MMSGSLIVRDSMNEILGIEINTRACRPWDDTDLFVGKKRYPADSFQSHAENTGIAQKTYE